MRRSRTIFVFGAVLVMSLGSVAGHASPRPVELGLGSAGALTKAVERAAPLRVSVPGLGTLALVLRDNPIVAPGARTTVTDPAGRFLDVRRSTSRTLAGSVTGDPSSIVRLTIAEGGIGGFIATEGRRMWINPHPKDSSRTIARPDTPGAIAFGDDAIEPAAGPDNHGGQVNVLGLGSCTVRTCSTLTAHVILDGDLAYKNLAADCFGRQLTVLNAVDGIFSAAATKIRLSVVQQNCRSSADLGSPSTPSATLLDNLRRAWTGTGASRSLVYLFTGNDLPDSAGVAYTPGVCGRIDPAVAQVAQRCSFGYSLGQMVGGVGTFDRQVKVTAHEIGHNFNAAHDNNGCAGAGQLMCSSIQPSGPQTFSSFSAGQIRSHAEETIGYIATY